MTWLDDFLTRFKYNQYQTRVPAGYRDGGQWSNTGSSREGPSAARLQSINRTKKPKPLSRLPSAKPVKPLYVPSVRYDEATQTYKPVTVKPKPFSLSFSLISSAEAADVEPREPPLGQVYFFESISSLGALGRALLPYATRQVAGLATRAIATYQAARRIHNAYKEIEKFFGGRPDKVFRNQNGDIVMMKSDKQIRFDINNFSKHERPYFHILRQRPNGKWTEMTEKHEYYFREE